MKEPTEASVFWSSRGPLQTLTCAALLIAASDRLSKALLVAGCLIFTYAASALFAKLFASLRAGPTGRFSETLVSAASAFVFYRLCAALWPLSAMDAALYLGAVPLCFLAYYPGAAESGAEEASFKRTVKDSVSVALLLVAFSLVREPLGHACLTLPGAGGLEYLFGSASLRSLAARSVAACAGGLMLLGYAVSLFRVLRRNWKGVPIVSEDDR